LKSLDSFTQTINPQNYSEIHTQTVKCDKMTSYTQTGHFMTDLGPTSQSVSIQTDTA